MRRREIPKILLAAAAGPALDAHKAQAQSSNPPSYPTTRAELAAGVTPTRFARGELALSRYSPDAATALSEAASVAARYGHARIVVDRSVSLTSSLTIPANVTLIFDKGARISPAKGIKLTIDGSIEAGPVQIFDCSASGSRITGKIRNPHLLVEWWGAVGDGTADDTMAFQRTARAAADAGCIDIRLLAKTYKITDTVHANGADMQDFAAPSWYGVEQRRTIIDYTTIGSGKAALKFRGGSGRITRAVVQDIGFVGNAGSIGVAIAGKCGMRVIRCLFSRNAVGVRFHNEEKGSFTELNVLESCEADLGCFRLIQYRRGAGNDSFHGCGLRDCLVNAPAGGAVVDIGPNCKPYNCPLDVRVFAPVGAATLVNNGSALPNCFFGSIAYECAGQDFITFGKGNLVYFSGSIVGTSEVARGGTLLQCQAVIVNADSSVTPLGVRRAYRKAIRTGRNRLASLYPDANRLVYVSFRAPGYDYRYLLNVDHDGTGGNGFVAIVATIRQFDGAGYGEPKFSVDTDGQLVATHASWPAKGVMAYWSESGISPGSTTAHPAEI